MTTAAQSTIQAIFDLYRAKKPNSQKLTIYSQLAERLSKTIGRPQAWSWCYIQSVITGSIEASPELSRAAQLLAAQIDGQPVAFSNARPVQVQADPSRVQADALVMGESKQCAYEPCMIEFVPPVPWGKYCPAHKDPKNRK